MIIDQYKGPAIGKYNFFFHRWTSWSGGFGRKVLEATRLFVFGYYWYGNGMQGMKCDWRAREAAIGHYIFFFFFYLAIDGMGRELKVESVIGEGQYMAVRLRLSRGKY